MKRYESKSLPFQIMYEKKIFISQCVLITHIINKKYFKNRNKKKLHKIPYSHPGDNPFYSNIDSMPDIRPRRKSIPLVSELVSVSFYLFKVFFRCCFYVLLVRDRERAEPDYFFVVAVGYIVVVMTK